MKTGTAEAEPYVPAVMPEFTNPIVSALDDLVVVTPLAPEKIAKFVLSID